VMEALQAKSLYCLLTVVSTQLSLTHAPHP
jgi:hypothetical protein